MNGLPKDTNVKRHPPRTALVGDRYETRTREETKCFERLLAQVAGKEPENLVVYALTPPGQPTFYVMFAGHSTYFGRTLRQCSW